MTDEHADSPTPLFPGARALAHHGLVQELCRKQYRPWSSWSVLPFYGALLLIGIGIYTRAVIT